MGLFDFTQSRGWKVFIAKLYGLGAAVVIVGALFKIQHYPGAGFMLAFGLITEAVIFFFSAFEPLPHETDWEIVFPELLTGVDDKDIIEPERREKKQRLIEKIQKIKEKEEFASCWPAGGSGVASFSKSAGASTSGAAIQKFDEMLEKAGGANFFEKLGDNFANFNEKVKDMADIADSAAASKEFAANLKGASASLEGVKSSADGLQYSVNNIADSYSKLADNMNIDFSAVKSGNKEYSENITSLNKNLGAVNQIFEIQLKEVDFDSMISELKGSVQYAQQYSQEVSKLSKNLSALNNVYGNMLTALNVKVS